MSRRKIRDDGLVHQFLTHHLLRWLEALSLLGRITESIGMVDSLLGYLDVRPLAETYCSTLGTNLS